MFGDLLKDVALTKEESDDVDAIVAYLAGHEFSDTTESEVPDSNPIDLECPYTVLGGEA